MKNQGVDVPDRCRCECIAAMLAGVSLPMSICEIDAELDDHLLPWIGDNNNEAPFTWKGRGQHTKSG